MNRENFIEALREQFAEEIHQAYLSCEDPESEHRVDLAQLKEQVFKILKSAQIQGFPEEDFLDLLSTTLPDLWEHLGFGKKVA